MRILFFTGSRGEWGYIKPILSLCKKRNIKYNICVTNMHLLENYGYSVNEIINDGFKVSDKIFMALDGYNPVTMSKSMGVLMTSLTDVISRIKPDWVVLAGDRSETLVASIVSSYMYIPVAHIQAGELSGNIDGLARHAIGKFAHMHFASNKDAYNRLMKLGEEKFRIKLVGAPQLDDIKKIKKTSLSRKFITEKLGIDNQKYILSVYHPVTEEYANIEQYTNSLTAALNTSSLNKVWILPNNDSGSLIVKKKILQNSSSNQYLFENLNRENYLLLLKHSECIIGNSSSGIIEAPSFGVPCVNIGRRQNMRVQAKNVINIKKYDTKMIKLGMQKAINKKFKKGLKNLKNPYGDGNSAERIIKLLISERKNKNLLIKNLTF